MKNLLITLPVFLALSVWQPDFQTAQKNAVEKHHLILLNFSGSDWCGPCIRMHKEIFDSPVFSAMADSSLELVNADFPRNKNHQLSKTLQKQNDALADKYNPQGKFPLTLLLNASGKVIKTWDGFPDGNAEQFTSQVKKIYDAAK